MAASGSTIDSFKGDFAFLSNFWPIRGGIRGYGDDALIYPTAEAAFQAAKTHDASERQAVRDARTPTIAKRLGRKVALRADWETIKLSIMAELVRRKFAPGSELAGWLAATGDTHLVEGNNWNDRYWGVCRGTGLNHLGTILMAARAALGKVTRMY
jgi:hypothetical protein